MLVNFDLVVVCFGFVFCSCLMIDVLLCLLRLSRFVVEVRGVTYSLYCLIVLICTFLLFLFYYYMIGGLHLLSL